MLLVGCGRVGFGEASFDAADGPQLLVDVAPLDAAFPSGLVAWFPLDDQAATSVVDVVSGFGGMCTGSECATQVAGHRGTAFGFDGDDDCIQVPNMGQFGQAQLTLSVWIRQDTIDVCTPVAKPAENVSTTANTWQIETTTNNEIEFSTTHGGSGNMTMSTPVNTLVVGQWQHVAATYDGAMKRLYVNGAQVATDAETLALTYGVQPMWIGCDVNSGNQAAQNFAGAIDEVQLYNRALTLPEVQALAAM